MAEARDAIDLAWNDALVAMACVAVDPVGLGGVRVRAAAGPVRDAWSAHWRALLDATVPVRTVPIHVDDGRLLGGIDLAASLRSGRPVHQPGLLAQVDGGYAVLAMAERIDASTAGRIAAAMEHGSSARFGVIAFDEGDERDAGYERDTGETLAPALVERLALCIDLRGVSLRDVARAAAHADRAAVANARAMLSSVEVDEEMVGALCTTAVALGIASMRMPSFAVRVARIVAALAGRATVDVDDAARAARLVYASRARQLPADAARDDEQDETSKDEASNDEVSSNEPSNDGAANDEAANDAPPAGPAGDEASDPERRRDAADAEGDPHDDRVATDTAEESDPREALAEVVLDAAIAAMPADLLKRLAADAARGRAGPPRAAGAGAFGRSRQRGAPAGIRRGRPRPPERLSLIETLRAAAPWQRIRRAEVREADDTADARADLQADPQTDPQADVRTGPRAGAVRVQVRAEDLHVVRFAQRRSTTTVFVVDASGSSALHRLAEAKGAVELLLAECYVRRDSVAVLAFRGKDTRLLLPPTRSLVRARRGLASLPGGGGTPLASALDATRELVVSLRGRGDTVLVVLLTDGRGNVARDGRGGRAQAEVDATASARALRVLDVDVLFIDTSPQPSPQAARLAGTMGATYRPLPHAGANEMSRLVNRAARGLRPS